jgi:large subunit ribosomal protein L6
MLQSNFFKISSAVLFSIHIIKNQTFLVSSGSLNKRYFRLPKCVIVVKEKNRLFIKSKGSKGLFLTNFIETLGIWLSERPITKKILLKGLGFKAIILENHKTLDLKIGLSHSVKVPILPDRMSLKINKKIITIKGFISTDIGNFAERIRKLRLPDSYKGKGLWYKNENRALKLLKKK